MTATLPEPYLDLDGDDLSARNLYEVPWHADFLAWMRSQGMNPDDARRVEVFIVDCPFARVTMFVRGEHGTRIMNEARDGTMTATETMLVSSLPPLPPALVGTVTS